MAAICHFPRERHSSSISNSIVSVLMAGVRRLSRALKNRRQAGMLAAMDDRMLADIGLTRSDLRDAYAEPLWRDPTDVLAGRARDKRVNRRTGVGAPHVQAPGIAPDAAFIAPPTDRPARHTL